MYTLTDFLIKVAGITEDQLPSAEIFCAPTDANISMLTNKMQDTLRCFTFTLITQGDINLQYGERQISLRAGDIYVYTPGMPVKILNISDNYEGYVLLLEEMLMFETPVLPKLLHAAYIPFVDPRPRLRPTEGVFRRLEGWMKEIHRTLFSNSIMKQDALRLLVSLFLIEVIEIDMETPRENTLSKGAETLIINFFDLLRKNYIQHRNIEFYSNKLCVSKTYLARILKKATGRTVMDFIDRMILMEASWLLQSSDKNIGEIADMLNFSDQATFTRFFSRNKGIPPRKYRESLT